VNEEIRERAEFYTARKRRRRRGCLAVLLVPLVLVVAVGVWLGGRLLAKPTISRNFTAEFNARYDGVPDSDRAWPLYKDAIIFRIEHPMPERVMLNAPVMPNWSMWDANTKWLTEMAPALELMREGGRKPVLARPMSNVGDEDIARAEAQARGIAFTPETPVENPSLIESLDVSSYGHFRRMAQALAPDVYFALENGDTDRAVRNIEAMLGMGVHAGESETIIGVLIRIAIGDLAARTTVMALSQHPDAFSAEQLARLQSAFQTIGCAATPEPGVLAQPVIRLSMERAFFLDMIQRTFSDNGRGDGYVTLAGATSPELVEFSEAAGPVGFVMAASRKEIVARHDELMRIGETAINSSAAARHEALDRLDAALAELNASWVSRARNVYLTSLLPVYPKVVRSVELSQSKRGAAIAALAMRRYRRERGSFPQSLEALMPEYIPAMPVDPVDGNTMRYRLGPDGPVLYSLGADGDDDGGLLGADEKDVYPTNAGMKDGDWILYPVAFPDEREDRFAGEKEPEDEVPAGEPDQPSEDPEG